MEEKTMTNEQAYEIAMKAIDEAYENERPLLYLIPPKEDIEMVELRGTINMHEPEPFDECDYDAPTHLHTIGFVKVFGKEAITMYLKTNPDILILDNSLTDMTVEDIVNRLSSNPLESKKCNTILTLPENYNIRMNNYEKYFS